MEIDKSLADHFLVIRDLIMHSRYVVRIHDRGLVYAYCYGPKEDWVELYSWNPKVTETLYYNGFMVQHVRAVAIEMEEDEAGEGLTYYGEEAERVWEWFSRIAVPLMNVTLDIQT